MDGQGAPLGDGLGDATARKAFILFFHLAFDLGDAGALDVVVAADLVE